MQRITISIDDDLLVTLDALMARRGYANRSEAIRDIVRETLVRDTSQAAPDAACVATLSYVFDHHRRDLSQRLTHHQHDHHDLAIATMHVHLDHDSCLEVAVLKGPHAQVRALGDGMIAERGVRYGALHLIPATIADEKHDHGAHGHAHGHDHGHDHGHAHGHGHSQAQAHSHDHTHDAQPRHTHIRV
jgi:CopG family nickel-responsive transcriptional regulator